MFPIQKQNQARYCHKTSDSSNSNYKQSNFPNLNLQYPIRYNDWPVPRRVFELSHLFYKRVMKKSDQFRKPLRRNGYEGASFLSTRDKNQQTVVLQRFADFCFPLILFLYRSAAICSMQIRDVNLNTGTISYRQIKNKSVQIVPLCSEMTIIFLEYLHIREGQPQEYLLSDDSGSMMTESRLRYAI